MRFIFLAFGIALIACSSKNKQEMPIVSIVVPNQANTSLSVQDVKIEMIESFPVQVVIVVEGTLPKKCQALMADTAQRNRNFFVTLTATERASTCSSTDNTFTEMIPLDVSGLKAGEYQVNVHGLTRQFELVVDNIVYW